jgi:hypothetical protein
MWFSNSSLWIFLLWTTNQFWCHLWVPISFISLFVSVPSIYFLVSFRKSLFEFTLFNYKTGRLIIILCSCILLPVSVNVIFYLLVVIKKLKLKITMGLFFIYHRLWVAFCSDLTFYICIREREKAVYGKLDSTFLGYLWLNITFRVHY